jgi:hypothetical protein
MSGRIAALIVCLALAGEAHAHALDAQAFLLPGGKVQVEAWFSSGDPARAALVQVVRADGQTSAEGQTDDQGIAVLPLAETGTVRIVVSAGSGHRKELSVTVGEAERPTPLADRGTGLPVKDILIGVGFVLALAAFALTLRNSRRLRALEAVIPSAETPRRAVPPTAPGRG